MALPYLNSSSAAPPGDSARSAPGCVSGYGYGDAFYRYIESGSLRSARVIVPLVLRELSPCSVLDVGCGAGAWLSEYRKRGISDCLGVDGAYVGQNSLLIPAQCFHAQDISQDFDLGRQFDVVQCLEVGEHLPPAFSRALVENLTRHGDRILFSAATPGQGGENHINEQGHEFWRFLFAEFGYMPFDMLRPRIKGMTAVESWYRRNILLYIAHTAIPTLSPALFCTAIADDQAIPVMASFGYRMRACALYCLPARLVSRMARIKHRLFIAFRWLRNR